MAFDATHCELCPRRCGADRSRSKGLCGGGDGLRVVRAALHPWEEPCLSGTRGAGTVFFAGCSLRCCFCQNYPVGHGQIEGERMDDEAFAALCLDLQAQGAHNIDLVTPMHWAPWVIGGLRAAKARGLRIPVVCNTGGYDLPETVEAMAEVTDVWLPDLKFKDDALAQKYSGAQDYFEVAARAIEKMAQLAGAPRFDGEGLLCGGVLVRHLILPGGRKDSMAVLDWLHDTFGEAGAAVSVMSQYTPCYGAAAHKEINRRITRMEHESVREHAMELGFRWLYGQERAAATLDYTPDFTRAIHAPIGSKKS
ncbi:MAG: radical SAM protein [Eubacteriales bacterium]|nr:radical SAM protein [Eubacteriales bacterium]